MDYQFHDIILDKEEIDYNRTVKSCYYKVNAN